MLATLVAAWIVLTGPDGQRILVAPQHIVSMRAPRARDHFARGTNCLLLTDDGKLISVANRCDDIQRGIEGH